MEQRVTAFMSHCCWLLAPSAIPRVGVIGFGWCRWKGFTQLLKTASDPDAGRDWGQEEKGTTEDEMAGWHHWFDGRESQWTPGVGDGQGGLACCDSWGHKELDTTEQLIWSDLNHLLFVLYQALNYIHYVVKMVPFKCTDKGILVPTLLWLTKEPILKEKNPRHVVLTFQMENLLFSFFSVISRFSPSLEF